MEKFCLNQPLANILRESYGASHDDQMSPLQSLCKTLRGTTTLRVPAHTCGLDNVRRHKWAIRTLQRKDMQSQVPSEVKPWVKGQNAPNQSSINSFQ